MDNLGSKSKIMKRFSVTNPSSSEQKVEGMKQELDELGKSIGSSKKLKEEEKGFVFSLSQFEEKNRSSRGTNNKN